MSGRWTERKQKRAEFAFRVPWRMGQKVKAVEGCWSNDKSRTTPLWRRGQVAVVLSVEVGTPHITSTSGVLLRIELTSGSRHTCDAYYWTGGMAVKP